MERSSLGKLRIKSVRRRSAIIKHYLIGINLLNNRQVLIKNIIAANSAQCFGNVSFFQWRQLQSDWSVALNSNWLHSALLVHQWFIDECFDCQTFHECSHATNNSLRIQKLVNGSFRCHHRPNNYRTLISSHWLQMAIVVGSLIKKRSFFEEWILNVFRNFF